LGEGKSRKGGERKKITLKKGSSRATIYSGEVSRWDKTERKRRKQEERPPDVGPRERRKNKSVYVGKARYTKTTTGILDISSGEGNSGAEKRCKVNRAASFSVGRRLVREVDHDGAAYSDLYCN